jgi:Cu-Zn family superoxide dismutase
VTEPPRAASAKIEARSGSSVSGTASFTSYRGGRVILRLDVRGLSDGPHAAHIHDKPDCSALDGMSAGGHWNPEMKMHGAFGGEAFHLGDIGNVNVANGQGALTLETDLWTLGSGEFNDVLGHSVIVHAGTDDMLSQPAGNAGGRHGCGPIVE